MTEIHKDPTYEGEPNEADLKYEISLLKEALSLATQETKTLKRRLQELGEEV